MPLIGDVGEGGAPFERKKTISFETFGIKVVRQIKKKHFLHFSPCPRNLLLNEYLSLWLLCKSTGQSLNLVTFSSMSPPAEPFRLQSFLLLCLPSAGCMND